MNAHNSEKYLPHPYCTQPREIGEDCAACSLSGYKRDCRNNPIRSPQAKPMSVRDKIEAIRLADFAVQGSGLTRPHVIGPHGEPAGISMEALSLSNAIHEHGEWRESFTRNDGNLPGQRAVAAQAGMREIQPGIWRFPA